MRENFECRLVVDIGTNTVTKIVQNDGKKCTKIGTFFAQILVFF